MAATNPHDSGRSSTDTNSLPNLQDNTEEPPATNNNAPSLTPTKMDDIVDEEEDEVAQHGPTQARPPQPLMGRLHGLTGPVGEPGLPPSRPSSAATARSGAYSQAASRRQHSSAAGSAGGAGRRPPSSASRTHVPSLTSSAFFRPMSSQRLQAQRNQRPMSNMAPTSAPVQDTTTGFGAAGSRQSNGSETIIQKPPAVVGLHHDERPISRGTDITDIPDRNTSNSSPEGGQTFRSGGDSEVPLSGPDIPSTKPIHLDLARPYRNSTSNLQPQKSPRSFRSSFALAARQSPMRSNLGHEKLESNPSTPRMSQGAAAAAAQKVEVMKELGKNHEYFTGNTVFCFGGRLQNARERPINLATGLVMALPAALFFGFSAPWLGTNVSPAIPFTFAYVFLVCFSSFVHASTMNPGILPRNLHPFPPSKPNEDPLALGPTLTEWTMVVSATSKTAAMEVPTKYCKTCNIWRPARAHHCRTCDNCIETQDHHCVWLNNCVGRRNYRHFFTFVAAGTILSFYLFAASLAHVLLYAHQEHVSVGESINKNRVPFAMVIYGILIALYPLSLTGYHLFLIGRGETTREYLQSHKFLKKDRHRPFTQGNFFKNCIAVLNRPKPPTYLHFKKKYEEGDRRYGEKRGNNRKPVSEEAGKGEVEMQKMGGFQGPTGRVPTPGTGSGAGGV
ncbi:zf-DHHC-domain-containing protein [Venturia nashicola]|nr:zf-DHHC-domain-containing protein [Venturia nashicola]